MAKSQTNAATSESQNLINQANAVMPGVVSGLQGQAAQSGQIATGTEQAAQSGYGSQQTTGGYNPQQLASLRSTLAGMQPTGGYDPTQLSNILGGYGGMAQTGGFTPQQQQQYLAQATQGTTNLASNLSSAAQRNAAATGGNAGAAISNIQQQAGAQQANATNQALTSLNQQINANKLAGLGGLGQTEANVAAAMQGVTGQQAGLESGVAQGVQGANAGMAGLYGTAAGQQAALNQQALQGLGLQFGTEAQGAQIMQELSKNPGLFGNITSFLSSLP